METMKAILCDRYGPPGVLRIGHSDRPVPVDDELLIKIYAASVTNSDIFILLSCPPSLCTASGHRRLRESSPEVC